MKKTIITACALVLAFLLSGCGVGKLPEGFDETKVTDKAKEIVALLNDKDFEAVTGECREDLRQLLPAGELEKSLSPLIAKLGGFKDYKTVVTAGSKEKETGEDFATVVLVCDYEKGTATYTISMNNELEIIGLYMK
ncbi:MAG: hypothetical protein BWY11_01539 [Firmicutes bacterium ADurb.Bin182]|nr:MAG: hypothetical protein BWY11_01539 [Firmicutes bacterium ADurb.Bin182]